MRYLGGWPSPDPNDKREGAVRYRVGSGESVEIPPEGLDSETWYALMTLTGVEWYDARGKRCNSPPPPALSSNDMPSFDGENMMPIEEAT